MRLYLDADSKNNVGYIPDWISVSYIEHDKTYTLTLDIVAEIEYVNDKLSCRCKGDLEPWTLYCYDNDEEINLSYFPRENINKIFSPEKIGRIIKNNTEFVVGIYPVDDTISNTQLIETDLVSKGDGTIEMYVNENFYFIKDFRFETDLNY